MTYEEFIEAYEHRRPHREWCTGGMSGGSCWGDEPHEIDGDDEPSDMVIIKEFIRMFDSTVTDTELDVIHYEGRITVERDWTDWEYYGNYYHMSSKTIDLEKAWPYVQFILDVPDSSVRQTHYQLMED